MEKQKAKRQPISNIQRIAYAKYENAMQSKVYPSRIKAKKMKPERANTNWQIIAELGELSQLLESKNISWYELLEFINDLPVQNKP